MTAMTVKPVLTPRRRAVVENDAYAGFAARVVRAYARRVADGDVEALPAMLALSAELDAAIGHAVLGLRGFGYSWAEIAARLGITRQAAHQRWANTAPAHPTGGGARATH
jgi:DNA-directed RNA polymerase specialized sigma24 family protein